MRFTKPYLADAEAVGLYTTSAVSLAGLLTVACRVDLSPRLFCGSGLLLLSVLRSVLRGSAAHLLTINSGRKKNHLPSDLYFRVLISRSYVTLDPSTGSGSGFYV
jgi:hypothetical protein